MPRIREYNSEISAGGTVPTRRADAADFSAGTLAGAGQMLRQAADDAYTIQQRKEVTEADTRIAERGAKWTVELEKRSREAAPGDGAWIDKFLEDYDNDTAEGGQDLTSTGARQAYQKASGARRSALEQSARMWEVRSAGAKATQDYLASVNAWRNTVQVDPGQFDSVLDQALGALNDPASMYARMPAADRAKLERGTREELAMSAVQGQIERDPAAALDALNNGRWADYLDADKQTALKASARQGINAERIEGERARVDAERKKKEAQEATANEFLQRMTEGRLTTKDIMRSNLDAFGSGSKDTFLKLIEKDSKDTGDAKMYGPGFNALFERIHMLPDGDPNKITIETQLYEHRLNGSLTQSGLTQLRQEVQGKRSTQGQVEADLRNNLIAAAKSAITGSDPILRIRDPKGDQAMQGFLAYFLPEYARQREAGKTPVQLLDPKSPDYLGAAIERFKRPRAVFMKDLMADNPGRPDLVAGDALKDAPDYKSKDDVLQDYRDGKLPREKAQEILKQNGWAR